MGPAPFDVRQAVSEDYALFVRFFAAFGASSPLPDLDWWAATCRDACFIEERGGAIGYGLAHKLADSAYVMHVAVDASARHRGVGRAIMHAVGQRLREQGCTRWTLTVKHDNAVAIHLYESLGMQIDFPVAGISFPWAAIDGMPRGDVIVEPFESTDDAALEDSLGIARGRIGKQRERGGRVLLRAGTNDSPSGLVAYDPRFPGAPLFRAQSPTVARALFEALRPYRLQDQEVFRVAVEADEALAAELVAFGGALAVSLFHMSGAIPEPTLGPGAPT
jgi:GNAT superfamily N-acetyltransferase